MGVAGSGKGDVTQVEDQLAMGGHAMKIKHGFGHYVRDLAASRSNGLDGGAQPVGTNKEMRSLIR